MDRPFLKRFVLTEHFALLEIVAFGVATFDEEACCCEFDCGRVELNCCCKMFF